jgi:hypothetical protein
LSLLTNTWNFDLDFFGFFWIFFSWGVCFFDLVVVVVVAFGFWGVFLLLHFVVLEISHL